MNKKVFAILLAAACIQPINAARLAIDFSSAPPAFQKLYITAESNGFKNGIQQQIVTKAEPDKKFDSGAHRISNITIVATAINQDGTEAPMFKFFIDETVPAATLTAKIRFNPQHKATQLDYNWGLGWKKAKIRISNYDEHTKKWNEPN